MASKIDLLDKNTLENIILTEKSFYDVLKNIGYTYCSSQKTISLLKEKCEKLNIDYTHLDYQNSNFPQVIICKECKKELSLDNFRIFEDRVYHTCFNCAKVKRKEKYNNLTNKIIEYKKTLKCKKCGENRFYTFDFHHRNPKEKDFNISDMTRNSFEEIKVEIDKCDCLCSNCHREFHYLYNLSQISYEDWLTS